MEMIISCIKDYPNFKEVATTLREVKTATINDCGAVLYYDGQFYLATKRENLEIYDRVGGGDSFASGLIYGFLNDKNPQEIVEYGVAHGALVMTTPGDTLMASLEEVEEIVYKRNTRIKR